MRLETHTLYYKNCIIRLVPAVRINNIWDDGKASDQRTELSFHTVVKCDKKYKNTKCLSTWTNFSCRRESIRAHLLSVSCNTQTSSNRHYRASIMNPPSHYVQRLQICTGLYVKPPAGSVFSPSTHTSIHCTVYRIYESEMSHTSKYTLHFVLFSLHFYSQQ